MSLQARHLGLGGRTAKREVVDVPETPKRDDGLSQLLQIRKQRIERFERECALARRQWREARAALHSTKERWRDAKRDAADFWRQARADFLRMTTTSGEFRKAKGTYERMKDAASQVHLECREAVEPCKSGRKEYFAAKKAIIQATREYEKLVTLRGELTRIAAEKEQIA